MLPPGIADFMSRVRLMAQSRQVRTGRAWSGYAPVTRVEVSTDGGRSWAAAELGDPVSPFAWRPWTYEWDATPPGDYELSLRPIDGAGNLQPTEHNWSPEGRQNNAVQLLRALLPEPDPHLHPPAHQPPSAPHPPPDP